MPTAIQKRVYLPWTPGVQPSWTVSGVRSALTEHEVGQFSNSALLVDAMFRDDRLAAVAGTRLNALFGLPVSFESADESDKAAAVLAEVEENWPTWAPESALRELKLWQIMMGFAVAQIVWEHSADRWTPSIKVWHPQYIYADQDRGVFVVQTQTGPVDVPIAGGDGKWLVLGTGDRPWMSGLVRALAVPWLVAQFALRDWGRYSERHGMPIVKAMVPAIADDIDKDEFFDDVRTLSTETTVQLPTNLNADGAAFDLELLEASDGSWQGFKGLLEHCHDTYAIAFTGNNLTTVISGGSFAAAESASAGLSKYVAADSAQLGTSMRRQFLCPWAGFNFVEGESIAPWPLWDSSPPEDLKLKAETFRAFGESLSALKLGGAVPRDLPALAEVFGLQLDPNSADAFTDEKERSLTLQALATAVGSFSQIGIPLDVEALAESFKLPLDAKRLAQGGAGQQLFQYHLMFGAVTVNEVRQRLGFGPIAGGEKIATPADASAFGMGGDGQQLSQQIAEAAALRATSDGVALASGDDPRKAKGFVQGQIYADGIMDRGIRESGSKLPLGEVAEIIESATDYSDLRKRLKAGFADMDPEGFAEVMRKAYVLADLAGRWAATIDED